MVVVKIVAKLFAFILFIVLAILCPIMKLLQYLGMKVVAICLNVLILFVILAIIMKQWQNLAIFAVIIGLVLLSLVLFALLNFGVEDGRDGLKSFIFKI